MPYIKERTEFAFMMGILILNSYIMLCVIVLNNIYYQKSVGATATSIRKPMLEKFLIPIPPLSVQAKIVQILDTFTELTEQLTAELGMRQKAISILS